MTALFLKSDSGVLIITPSFTVGLEISVFADAVSYPRLRSEYDAVVTFVVDDFHLSDMWILEVDGEVF